MTKRILILNGATRKNGSTVKLICAFSGGAQSAGHTVRKLYPDSMNIHICMGFLRAGKDSKSTCFQKDDMELIYSVFADCDVVVFASPVDFWTITGLLKIVADHLYAELECLDYVGFGALLMTADGRCRAQIIT